jgi:hypothetical protein
MRIEFTGKDHHVIDHVRAVAETRIKGPNFAGEAFVRGNMRGLRLNGNYRVALWLTKNEVAELANAVFSEDRFVQVISTLAKRGLRHK